MILIIEDLHQLDPGSDIAEPACPRSLALGLQRMGFRDAQQIAERAARDADGRRLASRARCRGQDRSHTIVASPVVPAARRAQDGPAGDRAETAP